MGVQTGLTASEIRNGQLPNNFYGAPVNNVPYSLTPNGLVANVSNAEVYSAKTAGLAVGASITIFAGSPLGFCLNYVRFRLSASTEIQILNGATALYDDKPNASEGVWISWLPQGLLSLELGNPITFKNVAGAVTDVYLNAYWCRF